MTEQLDDIGYVIENTHTAESTDLDEYEEITNVVGTSEIERLHLRVSILASENEELSKRLSVTEARVTAMYAEFSKGKERVTIKTDHMSGVKDTSKVASTSLDGKLYAAPASAGRGSGVGSGSGTRSEGVDVLDSVSAKGGTPSQQLNPFVDYSLTMASSSGVFKSNSVVSPQGYVTNASVWGTALASLLIGSVRYYMTKRTSDLIMLDESKVASIYTKICPVLYETVMSKPLPKVKDDSTLYLSRSIARMSKGDVPGSTANDWMIMEKNQEGRDIMSILRTMLAASKMVPEAMVHPISQLIPSIKMNPIAVTNGVARYAIDANGYINPVPDKWESWCGFLKAAAIVKYVKYRISGSSPPESVSIMLSEMKMSELSDKKNWHKLADLNSYRAVT